MDKTTDELMKILNQKPDPAQYLKENPQEILQESLAEFLQRLLKEKNTSKADVIRRADLQRNYGYQFFNGRRKPSRDSLLRLAFGFQLTVPETQQLLKVAREPVLYPRVERDVFILTAIANQKSSLECNLILEEHGLALLE